MDHLPVITNPLFAPPRVRCLCDVNDYDEKGLAGFPARKGWKMDPTQGPIRTDLTQSSLAAFLQAWLFFGMLHDTFRIKGIHIEKNAFVYHQDNECYITTAPLKNYIDLWAETATKQASELSQHPHDQLRQCFLPVNDFFSLYADSPRPNRWSVLSCLDLDQVLSILILLDSLMSAANRIWYIPGHSHFKRFIPLAREENLLKNRLIQGG